MKQQQQPTMLLVNWMGQLSSYICYRSVACVGMYTVLNAAPESPAPNANTSGPTECYITSMVEKWAQTAHPPPQVPAWRQTGWRRAVQVQQTPAPPPPLAAGGWWGGSQTGRRAQERQPAGNRAAGAGTVSVGCCDACAPAVGVLVQQQSCL
jgi:hypothetical protein